MNKIYRLLENKNKLTNFFEKTYAFPNENHLYETIKIRKESVKNNNTITNNILK